VFRVISGRATDLGLPESGSLIAQVGYSRLAWREPAIHNRDRVFFASFVVMDTGPRFARPE